MPITYRPPERRQPDSVVCPPPSPVGEGFEARSLAVVSERSTRFLTSSQLVARARQNRTSPVRLRARRSLSPAICARSVEPDATRVACPVRGRLFGAIPREGSNPEVLSHRPALMRGDRDRLEANPLRDEPRHWKLVTLETFRANPHAGVGPKPPHGQIG